MQQVDVLPIGASVDSLAVDITPSAAWRRAAVFANDGTGSMLSLVGEEYRGGVQSGTATKAEAVDDALRALVASMKRGPTAANYRFGFISFNETVTESREPRELLAIPDGESFNPTAAGIGRTAIYSGLEASAAFVEAFFRRERASELPLSAVVVVLSDGEENTNTERTLAAAERLRAIPGTQVAAGLFVTEGQPPHGEPLLKELASRPTLYRRVHTGEELRKFFEESLTATAPGHGRLLGRGD